MLLTFLLALQNLHQIYQAWQWQEDHEAVAMLLPELQNRSQDTSMY